MISKKQRFTTYERFQKPFIRRKITGIQTFRLYCSSPENHKKRGTDSRYKKECRIKYGGIGSCVTTYRAGISTEEINSMVHDFTVAHGAVPAPLNYEGFPKSVCTSINDEVCHGIPDKDIILQEGDIINVDVSTILNGYFSDASRMFMIGKVDKKLQRLVKVTKECLEIGIAAAKPWGFLGDIGAAIQAHAEGNGYSVVRDFCGHGVGLQFHEKPEVEHIGKPGTGMVWFPE